MYLHRQTYTDTNTNTYTYTFLRTTILLTFLAARATAREHCNTPLQDTTTHCNTPSQGHGAYTATHHCNTLNYISPHFKTSSQGHGPYPCLRPCPCLRATNCRTPTFQHTTTHYCNTLQHTTATHPIEGTVLIVVSREHGNTLQHTPATHVDTPDQGHGPNRCLRYKSCRARTLSNRSRS